MILYRLYEISSGKKIISDNFRKQTNVFILENFYSFLDWIYKINNKINSFLSIIPQKIQGFLHFLWQKISNKIDRYFEKIRNHKKDGKKRKVSVYWQRVKGNIVLEKDGVDEVEK